MTEIKKEKPMIRIRGARENNLKNIDLDIPRNEFVVFTGLSGSGKSSLAFDTIYARRTEAVHGISVFLCKTVLRADGKAGCGEHSRDFPLPFPLIRNPPTEIPDPPLER